MTPNTLDSETLPRLRPGRVSSFRPLTIAAFTAGLGLLVAIGIDLWDGHVTSENARGVAVGRLAPRRAALQHAISQGFSVLPGLAAFVALHWDQADFNERFDEYGELLHLDPDVGIRTLQTVEDGEITHVWPRGGNEGAIGRNPLTDPRPIVREDFRRAMEDTEFDVTISGPLPLYQGGEGLIGRVPVAIPRNHGSLVVAAVLSIDEVIRRSGLSDTTSLRWSLRDQNQNRIAGEPKAVMAGLDPVMLSVRVVDGTWNLYGAPLGGWETLVGPRRTTRRTILTLFVVLLGALGYLLQSRVLARLETANLRERRDAEEHFALLFELVPDGVALVKSATDRYVQVNDAFCTVTGRRREELLDHTDAECGIWEQPDEQARLKELLATSTTGEILDQPFTITRPDGGQRETLISSRVIDLNGEPHRLTVVRDVHVRLNLERRLVASQRLEAIGRLAGGVAHDFNNLITAIGGYADLALDATSVEDLRHRDLLEIQLASRRAADLTRQLLTFARRQVVLPRRVDLAALARGLQPLLDRLMGDFKSVDYITPESAVPVQVDPSQIEHAIVNLVVNGRDAIAPNQKVTIRVGIHEGMALLEVEDTGVGIDPGAIPHLFEPFYTTKPVGKGTGLGLATVYGIVKQSLGTINVISELGKGTRISITLPLDTQGELESDTLAHRELPRGSEHILVVDDEPQVRDICQRLLTRLGYRVTVAADGQEALDFLSVHPESQVRLVLSDLIMPGMGGTELKKALAEQAPELPVILMSGYSQEALTLEEGVGEYLPKPFTADELVRVIRQRLGTPPRTS